MSSRGKQTLLRPLVAGIWLAAAAVAVFGPSGGMAEAAGTPSITITPNSGPPGTTVKVAGQGFCTSPSPCTAITIKVGILPVATGIPVGADGRFSTCVDIPGTVRPPSANVAASQADQNGATVSATATFTVTPSVPAPAQCSPQPTATPIQTSSTPTPKTNPPPASPAPTASSSTEPSSSPTTSTPTATPSPGTSVVGADTGSAIGLWLAIAIAVAIAAVLGAIGFVAWRRRER